MKILAWFIGFILLVLTGFMLLTSGWERPPMNSEQSGYRGTGMAHIENPRVDPPGCKRSSIRFLKLLRCSRTPAGRVLETSTRMCRCSATCRSRNSTG